MLQWLNGKKLLYLLVCGILILIFSYLLLITYPYFREFFSFLWRLFLPFLIAGFIAYLLFPVINFLDRQQIHKGLAVVIIYVLFFGGIGFLFYRVYPLVIHQMRDLLENFPEFVKMYEASITNVYTYTSFLPESIHDKIDELIISLETMLDGILSKLVNGFLHIFDMIIIITVIPVLVFYYIKDFQLLKDFFKKFLPSRVRGRAERMIYAMDEGLGGYIRGQFIVISFVILVTLIIFRFLNVPYALLLAILLGVTNIIPYFGPIIGAIPAVMIAYATAPSLAIYVVIAVFIVQVLEGNLLSPYIMGKNINIHPIAIIFVLLLGGELFGVIGMILAVPVLTVLKVIFKHLPSLLSAN